jgi:hypothetical protein
MFVQNTSNGKLVEQEAGGGGGERANSTLLAAYT